MGGGWWWAPWYNDFDINSTRRSSLASTNAVPTVPCFAWSASCCSAARSLVLIGVLSALLCPNWRKRHCPSTHSLTHSLTYSLTYLLTHSLTHSLPPPPSCCVRIGASGHGQDRQRRGCHADQLPARQLRHYLRTERFSHISHAFSAILCMTHPRPIPDSRQVTGLGVKSIAKNAVKSTAKEVSPRVLHRRRHACAPFCLFCFFPCRNVHVQLDTFNT